MNRLFQRVKITGSFDKSISSNGMNLLFFTIFLIRYSATKIGRPTYATRIPYQSTPEDEIA